MNFKILLVLPAGERVRVTQEHPGVPRRAMKRFSVLPLTVVAALTPRHHAVRLVDENVEPLDFDTDCDIVGITFMTALAPRAYEIAREFRRRGKLVVAGGYHATLCPEDAAPHFDALVVGDAEGAWERLLADAETGKLAEILGGPWDGLHTEGPLTPALIGSSKVIHRRRGELRKLSPQPTVNNFGATKILTCEQVTLRLQVRRHAELGRRMTPPLSRDALGETFAPSSALWTETNSQKVAVSSALYKAFAGPEPCVTP